MIYIKNAFSLNMLNVKDKVNIEIEKVELSYIKNFLSENEYKSVIGHEGTALFLSKILNLNIAYNREAIKLAKDDILIVFQLKTRLPEGLELSEEEIKKIKYDFYMVKIQQRRSLWEIWKTKK